MRYFELITTLLQSASNKVANPINAPSTISRSSQGCEATEPTVEVIPAYESMYCRRGYGASHGGWGIGPYCCLGRVRVGGIAETSRRRSSVATGQTS